MPRWLLIIAACLAVMAGIVMARSIQLQGAHSLWLLVPFVVVSLRRHTIFTLILLCLLCMGIGWWRGTVYMQKLAVHESFHYQKVTLVGKAAEDAVYGERYQLEFSMANVQVVAPDQTPIVGKVTIRGFGEAAVYRGDVVQATGRLYPTLGNNLASVSFAELRVLERGEFWVDDLRRNFAAGLQSALPEPAASLGLGLLIGERSTLPKETEDQLREVGLTHIIAVSGYNLTIIVLACRRLLAKRSKYQATIACLALIGLFLLITGTSPPIVRASIISLLAIGAWYYGRNIKPLVLLLVAAAITLIMNPLYLWGNVSWYLSFLAFFGVLVLAPLLAKRLFGNKEPKLIVSILLESACATICVLPYILYIFGEMSLVSLPANLLALPFVPLAMLLSLVAGLGGMFIPALAGWIAWPANVVLTYLLDVANMLSRIPHAFVENIGFSLGLLCISYGIIGFICLILWGKVRKKYGTITDTNEIL